MTDNNIISDDDGDMNLESLLLPPLRLSMDICSSVVSDTSDENRISNINEMVFQSLLPAEKSETIYQECGLTDKEDSNSMHLLRAAIIGTPERKNITRDDIMLVPKRPTKVLKRSKTLPCFFRVRDESSSSSKEEDDCWTVAKKIAKTMKGLGECMKKLFKTQGILQEWDRKNGLPLSHSPSMMNTSRSRTQLTDGVILKKWNGNPLMKNTGNLKVVSTKRNRRVKLVVKKRIVTERKAMDKTKIKKGDESSVGASSLLTLPNQNETSPDKI